MKRTSLAVLILSALAACEAAPPTTPNAYPPDLAVLHEGSSGDHQLTAEVRAGLARIRHATARFHDVDRAMAADYTVWSPDPFAPGATCPSSPEGQMGYHLVNVGLRGGAGVPAAGDANIDLKYPEMLLYEKRADGKMHLVGVEYLVFQAAWERVHGVGAGPPEILGQPLLLSSHSFTAGGPPIPHYELHVWVWRPNPLGMFYPWNPRVSC